MSEIRKYILVDRNDEEVGDYFDDFDAAKRAAASDCAVVAHVFEYADQELVWTPNGDQGSWPPDDD